MPSTPTDTPEPTMMDTRFANDPPTKHPRVQGRCPACGHETLFLGSNGYVTCSWLPCRNPGAPTDVLKATPAGQGHAATPAEATNCRHEALHAETGHVASCFAPPDALDREALVKELAKQVGCAHDNRTGGNDYILCHDCGLMWDYRQPGWMGSDGPRKALAVKVLALIHPAPTTEGQ